MIRMKKRRQIHSLEDIFSDEGIIGWVIEAHTIQYDLDGTFVPVVDFEDLELFIWNHLEWCFFHPPGPYQPETAFWKIWEIWKDAHKYEIDRIAEAWFAKYNPIGNYDKTETDETKRIYDSLNVERQWGDVDTDYGARTDSINYGEVKKTDKPASYTRSTVSGTRNGMKQDIDADNYNALSTVSNGNEVKDTTSVSTYNTAEKQVESTKHEGDTVSTGYERMMYDISDEYTTEEEERTDTNTKGNQHDKVQRGNDNETTTGGYTDYHTNSTSGNIGVTTSQQMIEAEWELRRKALASRLLQWFADECLFLTCEEGDAF